MNLLDLFIVVAMIFFVVRGLFRGFFREIGSIAGVILGIWIGCVYQTQITACLGAYFPSWKLLPVISFAAVFFVVVVLCNLVGWGLSIISKKAFLGWADKILGAGLAILKGIIITYLVIILLTFFVPSKTPFITGSRLAPLIISSYQSMTSLIFPDYYDKWKRKFSDKI